MIEVNGIRLSYTISGKGEIPLVLVHGSWVSRQNWDLVVPQLENSFRVLAYDRRGHGDSERPGGQGSILEDVADLAALIENLGLAPAWVAGNSLGGSITLRLAGDRPELLRGITVHEPPLFSLIEDDPNLAPLAEKDAKTDAKAAELIASGDHAGAAEYFIEANAPGMWTQSPPEFRKIMIDNAPSFLDDANDPDLATFELEWIRGFPAPALLTLGDQSPPQFAPVISKLAEALPTADISTFRGAGHAPHMSHPDAYVEAITSFVRQHTT